MTQPKGENAAVTPSIKCPACGRDEGDAQQQMMDTRKRLESLFRLVVILSVALIIITLCVALRIPFSSDSAMEKALLVRLVQITFGMVLGSSCVFFGVVVAWLGITAGFSLNAVGQPIRLGIQSSSPALALIVGGIILIGVSLYKQVDFADTKDSPGAVIQPVRPD